MIEEPSSKERSGSVEFIEAALPSVAEIGVQAFKIVSCVCKFHAFGDIPEIIGATAKIGVRDDSVLFVFQIKPQPVKDVECGLHAPPITACGNCHLFPAGKQAQFASIADCVRHSPFGQRQVATERRVIRRKRRSLGMSHEKRNVGSVP